ncbi:MAG TPA: GNAT family N-acetyltransferase [Bacteroidia bacterium]|jgi:hypothetical protein
MNEEVLLRIDETKRGAFIIEENRFPIAEMKVHLEDNDLVVEDTQVAEEMRGNNLGKTLLEAMVDHARMNEFKIVPVCSFVKKQFEKNPEEYKDVWKEYEER